MGKLTPDRLKRNFQHKVNHVSINTKIVNATTPNCNYIVRSYALITIYITYTVFELITELFTQVILGQQIA